MAFQQIHINAPTGLDSLRESLVRMAQAQRQREQDAAENLRYGAQKKRQGMMDRQAALAKASELWQQGDREGAKAIMAPYGGQVEQYQTDAPKEWAPKLNQGEIDFADTLPMDRPGGPVAPQPPAPAPLDVKNFSFGGYTPPPDGSERAGDAELGGLMAKATNPLVAAAQAQAQRNKIMAQRLTGKFDDGTAWSIDPDQGKREGMARADKAFYDASGEGTDEAEQIREQYPQLRATYAAAGQDIDPKGVFAQFRSDAAGKRQEAAATERERMRWEVMGHMDDERQKGRDAAMDRARLFASGKQAGLEQGQKRIDLATKAGERATEGSARTAVNDVFRQLKVNELVIADRKYHEMLSNLTTNPNAALDAATSGQWVKLAQGGTGVISDSDMKVFWKAIGGLGDYVEGQVQGLINGRIAEGKRAIVVQAVQHLGQTAQANLAKAQKALEYHFDTSPNLAEYKDQMVGTYFPGYRAKAVDRRAIDKAKGAQGNLDRDLEGL